MSGEVKNDDIPSRSESEAEEAARVRWGRRETE